MRPLTLQQIVDWCGGQLLRGDPQAVVSSVSTDTRTIRPGSLFVALAGERYDAHDFIEQALGRGATAALVSREITASHDAGLIKVSDTLQSLQNLASAYRRTLNPFVAVGVTGSNGKTSTKDLLSSVLSQRYRVNATRGNLNNHIGLPLTVLSTEPDDTAGVWEMGMNHFGEIAPLAAIARPDIGVITNIGTAHIEFLGSREGIAQEKGMLAEAVESGGCVILNADDDKTPGITRRTQAQVITAGLTGGEVRAENLDGQSFDLVSETAGWRERVTLPVPGRHMISNALLAAAAGVFLGLSAREIKTGLESARLHSGRLERKTVADLHFIDDSYNANPDSMKAALRTLVDLPCPGRRIAVLGRMGELGPHALSGHESVGATARSLGVDFLCTVGNDDSRLISESFDHPAHSRHFQTHHEAAAFLKEFATPQDLILLKGSRAAAMEGILHHLASEASPETSH